MCKNSKLFMMGPNYHLKESVKLQIIGCLVAWHTIMEAARCVNISTQSLGRGNSGTVVRKPGKGRKRIKIVSQDQCLPVKTESNIKTTDKQLDSKVAEAALELLLNGKLYIDVNDVCFILFTTKG